jgi:xylulokinase
LGEWAPYWDEQMRASFIGLTARHTRSHLTRAVLEGVAFALKDALAEMEGLGLEAKDICLIGQGSKSALWAAIVANVLDRPLRIPEEPDAAYGIALMTAMGVGAIERTPEALDTVIAMRQFIEPAPEVSRAYATLFDIYRDADAALGSIDARLHDFERRQARP